MNEGPNALLLAVIGVAIMLAGYFLYSKYLSKKVVELNAQFRHPRMLSTTGPTMSPPINLFYGATTSPRLPVPHPLWVQRSP